MKRWDLAPGSVADGLGHPCGGSLDGRRKAFPEPGEGGLYGYDPYAGHLFEGGEEDRKGDPVGGEGRPFHVLEPEKARLPRFAAAIGRVDDDEARCRSVWPASAERYNFRASFRSSRREAVRGSALQDGEKCGSCSVVLKKRVPDAPQYGVPHSRIRSFRKRTYTVETRRPVPWPSQRIRWYATLCR